MLIGSMSSLTPRFSTQVSPSCSCSSNSKPYCMPEQPPPCTKTRSLRFGLPSPRIRSPTLRAAASVNLRVSVSISVMACTLPAGFCRRNRRGALGRGFRGFVPRRLAERHQFPGNDGAGGHFNDPVVNIAVYARIAAELQALSCLHVAVDGAIHDDVGDFDVALDEAAFADRQGSAIVRRADYVAVDSAIQMQATREHQVSIESGGLADERIDARGCLFATT